MLYISSRQPFLKLEKCNLEYILQEKDRRYETLYSFLKNTIEMI